MDEYRVIMMKEKCDDKPITVSRNIDMGTLPPCRKCLIQHIKRVNFQVAVWKNAHIAMPNMPVNMENHGWTRTDGNMEPLWIEGDILPQQLFGILEETLEADSDDDEVEGNE